MSAKVKSEDDEKYSVHVISSHKDERKLDFYNINDQDDVKKKVSMNYFHDMSRLSLCKISNNLKTFVFVNDKENIQLSIH